MHYGPPARVGAIMPHKEATMKRLALLVILLMGFSAWAGTIQISPSPVPLKGTFQVCLMGLQAEDGDAVVVNVNTGELVRVPLVPQGGRLVSEEIYALRDCDTVPEGAEYVLHVAVGQVIAAATELDDGLSATALVTAPAGRPEISLEVWDAGRDAWCPRPGGSELSPGRILIAVSDPSKDVTCDRESVSLVITLGSSQVDLDLREDGPASGTFSAELTLSMEPQDADILVKLSHQGSDLLSTPARPELPLKVVYGDSSQEFRISPLDVALSLEPGPREDTGCPIRVSVQSPTPDEVRWLVDGVLQPEGGPELRAVRSQPTYPDSFPVVALVRKGNMWGKAEIPISFVPRTSISFVDAQTGEEIAGTAACGRSLKVKLEYVLDDGAPQVWVGILGPNCSARELALTSQGEGTFLSEAFSTEDLSACAGDVLWAQYSDPTCTEDVAYALLLLR